MQAHEPTIGMKVMSSDGTSLGKIVRVEHDVFVVEKERVFEEGTTGHARTQPAGLQQGEQRTRTDDEPLAGIRREDER
ncbi:MAG TPA: hypothetical protein VF875_13980 [Anaeromyxobacter sp.]